MPVVTRTFSARIQAKEEAFRFRTVTGKNF